MTRKKALKIILLGSFLLALPPLALPQVGHGTVEAFYYSHEKIAVAADSRVTQWNGQFSDNECKILPLDKHTLFFDTGIHDFTSIPGLDIQPWNNGHEAKQSYGIASASLQGPDVLERAAANWTQTTMNHLQSAYRVLPNEMEKLNSEGNLTDGFWAGVGDDGSLELLRVHIYFDMTKIVPSGSRLIRAELTPLMLGWNAESLPEELFAALSDNPQYVKTPRSDELEQWVLSTRKTSPEHWAVLTAVHAVELTVETGDIAFGKPVDAIELTPKDGIRWEKRKANCPLE